jgi:hypothetical protein
MRLFAVHVGEDQVVLLTDQAHSWRLLGFVHLLDRLDFGYAIFEFAAFLLDVVHRVDAHVHPHLANQL